MSGVTSRKNTLTETIGEVRHDGCAGGRRQLRPVRRPTGPPGRAVSGLRHAAVARRLRPDARHVQSPAGRSGARLGRPPPGRLGAGRPALRRGHRGRGAARDPGRVRRPRPAGPVHPRPARGHAGAAAAPGALSRPAAHGVAPRPAASETVTLVFDSGRSHLLRGTLLVGRRPENSHSASFRDPRRPAVDHPLLGLADLSRSLSKTHVLLEWSGTVLWVTDLQSANGTVLRSPRGERRPLTPGVPGAAGIGWTVQCGARSFTVHASSQQGGTTPLGPPAARQEHTGARPSQQGGTTPLGPVESSPTPEER